MSGWALVTGASRRIGRSITLELARHGWDVIVHYHHSADEARGLAEEVQALGRSACLAEIDLSDPQAAESLIPSLAEEIGMIDVLINNAALFEPDSSDPDGQRHWAVNANAPRLLSKAFSSHLPPHETGTIVNLLDATARAPTFRSYGKSKDFLADMTTNMAKSLAPQVRVHGVACGYVLPSPRQSYEAFCDMAGNQIVTPEAVATAVRRLIEARTSTGQIVTVA